MIGVVRTRLFGFLLGRWTRRRQRYGFFRLNLRRFSISFRNFWLAGGGVGGGVGGVGVGGGGGGGGGSGGGGNGGGGGGGGDSFLDVVIRHLILWSLIDVHGSGDLFGIVDVGGKLFILFLLFVRGCLLPG